ncbi:MAG: malto-oligosyltrehalose synthase [Geminicoccaceae bacterium]
MAPPPPTIPRATYRLQFHAGFGFADAQAIVPYLAALGISHLYASPITMARPGSMHGYDVIDFNRLNPELGADAAFDALIAELHTHDMGLVLDFVPNHMGVGSDNPWWLDVLEWGPLSPYATFFDIDWEASARGVRGKMTLPVLGDQYGKVLEAGDLKLQLDGAEGVFCVAYYDERFPIAVRKYPQLLHSAAGLLDREGARLFELADKFGALSAEDAGADQWLVRRQEAFALKAALAEAAGDAQVRAALEATVAALNGTPGLPETFEPLHLLLEDQAYRLAYWRVASSEINYRRFFDINQLAGLRMERGEAFEATHRLLLRLIAEGKVQGVRLDHIDGMYDPRGYCQRLLSRVGNVLAESREGDAPGLDPRAGRPIYLLVEKILAWHENLRDDLPVAGTTGYEFMNLVNGLFVDPAAERTLNATYHRFIDQEPEFDEIVLAARQAILRYSLDSELHVLGHEFHRLAQQSWTTRDFTMTGLREALADIITRFPVYRTYITEEGGQPEDRRDLDWAVSRARKETALVDHTVFDFLHAALSTDLVGARGYERADVIATAMHFQQLTGPVMAKSLEDTAFYRYHRLVSLNEVGGEPGNFGVSTSAFHHLMNQQQQRLPASMVTTATHDHKRGEDVRARINALSELPVEWGRRVRRWSRLNRFRLKEVDGRPVPGRNDQYLLYQTLVGSWPLGLAADDAEGLAAYAERIAAYLIKASREAKQRTSWTAPDTDYESDIERFVRRILDPHDGRAFLADFLPFQAQIALVGALNGLAQTLLKLTAPGVPDTYQGCELWDLSLVDPDNRRPVDFELRSAMLAQAADPAELLSSWQDGRVKQHIVARTLALRRSVAPLFAGDYTPLQTSGLRAERLVAFARSTEDASLIVIVPRLVAPLLDGAEVPLPPAAAWRDTRVTLPDLLGRSLHNPLTGKTIERGPESLAASDVLASLPVALLTTHLPA